MAGLVFGVRLLGFVQLLLERVAHQWPDLLLGVLTGNLATHLGVEVLRTGAGTLSGDGESVAQDQDTEGQQAQTVVIATQLGVLLQRALGAVFAGEVVAINDVGLQIGGG